jgi:hypothetical protein
MPGFPLFKGFKVVCLFVCFLALTSGGLPARKKMKKGGKI